MKYSQASQADFTNKRRSGPYNRKVGDWGWLLRRHIHTTRPSSKLILKRLGQFKIIKKIKPRVFQLDLPASIKSHPVYHISLLEPCATDPLPGLVRPGLPLIIVNDDEEGKVEQIRDSRRRRKLLGYLVR